MFFKFNNFYDSHVHWLYTGQNLHCSSLKNIDDANLLYNLIKESPVNQNGWKYIYGLDNNLSNNLVFWSHKILDQLIPETPVLISTQDGHSSYLNSIGMKVLNLTEWQIKESQHFHALNTVNKIEEIDIKKFLLSAKEYFLNQKIHFIRDMSTSILQFKMARELESENKLKDFHVELNFNFENKNQFDELVVFINEEKQKESENLKIKGLKFFLDGSLGSSTAALSDHSYSFSFTDDELFYFIKTAWINQLEVSVHAIGDLAVDKIVDISRKVSAQQINGILNIEHAEFVKPETIQKMKSLHVRLHFQPLHFWDDKVKLSQLSESLQKNAFPISRFQKSSIPFCLGSDSPVVNPSFKENLLALWYLEYVYKKNTLKNLSQNKFEDQLIFIFDKYKNYFSYPHSSTCNYESVFEINFEELFKMVTV